MVNPTYKVFVVGGGYDYIRLLYSLGFSGAKGFADADIILFTGGEDVDPGLYGEEPLKGTFFNRDRDDAEMAIYLAAVETGIPMVGICRGGQFLNVGNGGKMWQHVNNHAGPHLAFEIDMDGKLSKKGFVVTSTHHQMMRPSDDGIVLLVAQKATTLSRFGEEVTKKDAWSSNDTEVVWYPDTKSLCFQPHPEFRGASPECVAYFNTLMDDLIIPAVIANQKAA